MAHDSPALSQSKNYQSLAVFDAGLLQRPMTRVGTTPALAVTSPSRKPVRPIHGSITRHSAIQVDSQECLQPPEPAPHQIAARNEISSQLVRSTSERLATVPVIVPTRVTIAVQSELANGSHIARSHTFRQIATRHLQIAPQPRHAEAPHLVRMESNHLVHDSTAQHHQHPVVATRYPLSFIRRISLSPPSNCVLLVRSCSSETGFRLRESVV